MESTIRQISKSAYVVIGPEGATNFAIVKGSDGKAALIDTDIRRIDEVEQALQRTGCARVGYLIDTHEHFDHSSANFYFAHRQVPIIAGDLLYTEVHPVTFFGNIPNWLTALKPRFQTHYKHLVPGHGPTVDGEQNGKAYFKRMHDYLEDFYGNLQEINSGRKSKEEILQRMQGGAYSALGKSRMVERNIDQFLTGKWY